MSDAYHRLVRLLETHRPGDDPSALVELVPLARRRGETDVLARLARVFVDPETSRPPAHALTPPTSRGAFAASLDAEGRPLGPDFMLAEMPPDAAWTTAIAEVGCDPRLTRATQRLVRAFVAARPGSPPLDDDDDAEAAVCRVALERDGEVARGFEVVIQRLVDRWVVLGGLERAVRLAARVSRMALGRPHFDFDTSTTVENVVESARPTLPPALAERLWGWFQLARPRPARAEVSGWLRGAALTTDELEATLALWLDDDREAVARLCRRLVADATEVVEPHEVRARVRAVAALAPGQGEHLRPLVESLRGHVPALCEVLARVADRLGAEARDVLCARRADAGHHKYTGLVGQAIARIPGRETIRYFGMELGARARTRTEDARTACLYHPVDALLELPARIAAWDADPARKGRADRKRAIDAATAVLTDEIARLHPTATWLLLPTIADAALRARVEQAIPEPFRRDPDPVLVAEPFDSPDWLSSWPSAASARTSRYYDDAIGQACEAVGGALDAEQTRRVVLGLSETEDRAARRERVEALLEHVDHDTLVVLGHALLDHWMRALAGSYQEIWRVAFAVAVGDDALHEWAREHLRILAASSGTGTLQGTLHAIERLAPRDRWLDLVASLRHTTTRPTVQRWLDARLQQLVAHADDEPVPELLALTAVAPAAPWARPLAEQLLETWMIQGRPVALATLRDGWFANAIFDVAELRDRVLWARVTGADTPDDVIEVDVNGLRELERGWFRPLHPVLLPAARVTAAHGALRAAGREPVDWQLERAVWRGDDLPLAEPAVVPVWALDLLKTRGRWGTSGAQLPGYGEAHRLTETLRYDALDGATTLELTPVDAHRMEVVAAAPTTGGRARRSEACVDLTWLADMPATGDALRAWREARGLTRAQAERRFRVRRILADAEQQDALQPSAALQRAFWDERQAMR